MGPIEDEVPFFLPHLQREPCGYRRQCQRSRATCVVAVVAAFVVLFLLHRVHVKIVKPVHFQVSETQQKLERGSETQQKFERGSKFSWVWHQTAAKMKAEGAARDRTTTSSAPAPAPPASMQAERVVRDKTTTSSAPTPAPTPAPPAYCSRIEEDCRATKCCLDPDMRCYQKNQWWAECLKKSSCVPGVRKQDPLKYRFNWSCTQLSGPTPPPFHGWTYGTWTTGYWDCCKPSCSWPHKGNQTRPVRTCHSKTGQQLLNTSEVSVCDGGIAASCTSQQPFLLNGIGMGFAAAAVRGSSHHLTGDTNCGQCYELVFTDQQHIAMPENATWGGSSPSLMGKRMIVQITNIGEDVEGDHTFDIQIPGAGLGARTSGCPTQFPGTVKDDFDCGKRYGGCDSIEGCSKLPHELQAGCRWRYEWLEWLKKGGRTNNPFIRFRRVRCPLQLTEISGSIPKDDADGWTMLM